MSESERDVVTILDGIRAHKWLVLGAGLVLGIVAGALTWLSTPAATARGVLGLTYPAAGNVLLPVPSGDATMARYVAQRALFATSDGVLEEASRALPGTTVQAIRAAMSVAPSKEGNALVFRGQAASPREASLMVRSLMESYREQTRQDVANRAESLAKVYTAAGDREGAQRVVAEGQAFGAGVEFEVSPGDSDASTRPMLSKEALIGLLVGSAIGALIAWGIEDSRRRRHTTGSALAEGRGPDPLS